ncbi:MAG: glycosyl hydrolase family 65 protein [Clostridiales bacterium]|nr:glycosyl hydrolase family 65 protein [Clostridiales bacterium]
MLDFIVSENEFNKDNIPWNGNRFLIGNGYFGIRGTLEEYSKEHMCAVNMAGIYDRAGDAWRESVNAPNPLHTYIIVNGTKYALPETEPKSHTQTLDFKNGLHLRKTQWQTENGTITIECERFASMSRRHLIAMRYTFFADFECEAEIVTGIDGDVWDINGPHFVKIQTGTQGSVNSVIGTTGEKNISVTAKDCTSADFKAEQTTDEGEKTVYRHFSFKAEPGKEYTIEKIAQITTSEDDFDVAGEIDKLTYSMLRAEHITAWERIWDISKITIEGDDEAMYALNYSIYHLNCIAPREMKGKSIAARGLSGQVYKGAVFWDTEMFMIDYYIHTEPEIAKTLLQYRIDTINGARAKAAEYGLNGAYYAWESQEGGYEGCSDYNVTDVFTNRPMRTHFRDKQYHVSAAVVYGIMKYIRGTGDYSILGEGAMEVIVECAQMYRSLLLKYADKPYYEIHDVVGPDEYHERVNNNAYTNRMAKFVFDTALEMLDEFEAKYPEKIKALDDKYGLEATKAMLKDSAEGIFIREPDNNGIIEQFEGYFKLEDVSVDTVRSRLLDPKEYWGGAYGVAANTQVIKQADVAAMLSMFKDDYSADIMKKNFDYYEPRTEHGSSLSACMYSLLACFTGNTETAYPLFMKSAKADLVKGGKEWAGLVYIGGTHPASEGGAWIVAVNGFAGISEQDGKLVCRPSLPQNWKSMSFKLVYRGTVYKVNINGTKGEISY